MVGSICVRGPNDKEACFDIKKILRIFAHKIGNRMINDQIYSKQVLDFVKVAADYCLHLEHAQEAEPRELVEKMLNLLPYLYIMATGLQGKVEEPPFGNDAQVTEEDYNYVRHSIYYVLGQYDEYLDVFVEDMKYSDRPILRSVSEDLSDIYQDLRNFLAVYRDGVDDQKEAALWEVTDLFREEWGQKCVNVMRPLHEIRYRQMEEEQDSSY